MLWLALLRNTGWGDRWSIILKPGDLVWKQGRIPLKNINLLEGISIVPQLAYFRPLMMHRKLILVQVCTLRFTGSTSGFFTDW